MKINYTYENLKEGMEVSDYKDLCSLLGAEVSFGNSKVAQFKEWNKYFEYEKHGHSFTIIKVYDSPQETPKHLMNELQSLNLKKANYLKKLKELDKKVMEIELKLSEVV